MSRIKLAKLNDLDVIVNLLNEVTLDLHEQGINQWDYPWAAEKIKQEITEERVYILTVEEAVVGTFSIKLIDEFAPLEIKQTSSYLYRIAISPDYQGKGLGLEIVDYAQQYADELGKTLYLDCWSGNQKLRNFYSGTDFVFVGEFPEADYLISVFKYKSTD